jgi:hypothetical protein
MLDLLVTFKNKIAFTKKGVNTVRPQVQNDFGYVCPVCWTLSVTVQTRYELIQPGMLNIGFAVLSGPHV